MFPNYLWLVNKELGREVWASNSAGGGCCPKGEEKGREEVAVRRSRRSHDEQVTKGFALRAHMEHSNPGQTQSASNTGSAGEVDTVLEEMNIYPVIVLKAC